MKRALFAAALILVVSACGGGGGGGGGVSFKDPDAAQFTYATPATPTLDEQTAAESGAAAVGDALLLAGETDELAAWGQAESLIMGPMEMGGVFAGEVPSLLRAEGAATLDQTARAYLSGAPVVEDPGFDNPDCWSLTASALQFNGCRTTTSETGMTGTLIVDGALQREDGRVYWDLTLSMSATMTEEGTTVTMRFSDRLRGDIAYTAPDYVGFARSDISLSMSGGGEHVSAAVTYNADYDLTYTDDLTACPSRVTGGTLTLKRLWAELPEGVEGDPGEFDDASAQFTWAGCGSVNVAWGTP